MKNLKLRAWLKEDKEMISVEEMAFDTKYVRGFYKLDSRWFKLEQVELMQSTGLLDKNGTEIFEGDVLSTYTDNLVIKRDNLLGFYVEVDEKREYFAEIVDIEYLDLFAKDFGVAVEVLGNIYENPELLGQ